MKLYAKYEGCDLEVVFYTRPVHARAPHYLHRRVLSIPLHTGVRIMILGGCFVCQASPRLASISSVCQQHFFDPFGRGGMEGGA